MIRELAGSMDRWEGKKEEKNLEAYQPAVFPLSPSRPLSPFLPLTFCFLPILAHKVQGHSARIQTHSKFTYSHENNFVYQNHPIFVLTFSLSNYQANSFIHSSSSPKLGIGPLLFHPPISPFLCWPTGPFIHPSILPYP